MREEKKKRERIRKRKGGSEEGEETNIYLRADYMKQSLVVPIYFPPLEITGTAVVAGIFAIPTLGAWFVAHFWWNPYKERQRRKYASSWSSWSTS